MKRRIEEAKKANKILGISLSYVIQQMVLTGEKNADNIGIIISGTRLNESDAEKWINNEYRFIHFTKEQKELALDITLDAFFQGKIFQPRIYMTDTCYCPYIPCSFIGRNYEEFDSYWNEMLSCKDKEEFYYYQDLRTKTGRRKGTRNEWLNWNLDDIK